MSLSVDYDALAATTSIEDITDDELNREALRLLRDDDADFQCLSICYMADQPGEYHPGSSEELGWLGHFAKKSTHLDTFTLFGGDFSNCSGESVGRFFEDIGRCNLEKMYFTGGTDLTDILCNLGPVIENNNITDFAVEECYLGVPEACSLFNIIRDMKRLEELSIACDHVEGGHGLDDDIMARCIPSLAACTCMQKLYLRCLGLSTTSFAALNAILPRMSALLKLELSKNSIDDNCVQVLVRGLAECKRLLSLNLSSNRIGDDGLDLLIQGLPASVDTLDLNWNEVTLSRQLSLLRFKRLYLWGDNALSPGGARVIAASLANPECRLECLNISATNIGDEEAGILASSLWSNQRLACLGLSGDNITETGWNAFQPILCNPASVNATYGSNHTLEGFGCHRIPLDIKTLLKINSDQDKSRVAATKIVQTHSHLDMEPFFDRKLDLLPHVVAWLERFAEPRLDLKLSSIFEFVRSMPMEVVDGVAGKKKGNKRSRDFWKPCSKSF